MNNTTTITKLANQLSMLSKKISEFNHLDQLWKSRDPAKTAEGISKIINLMKGLLQLAGKLYLAQHIYFDQHLSIKVVNYKLK